MILMENGSSQDRINAGLPILSGAMMFDPLGWSEFAKSINVTIEKTISDEIATYCLARQMRGAKRTGCSEFASTVIENL